MHSQVQRDLEASILVWVPKLGAQKSLKVQYNILGGGMSFANWSPSGLCPRPIRGHHSSPPPPLTKKKPCWNWSPKKISGYLTVIHAHKISVYKKFEIKHLGEYHDLCVRSDTLLADAFNKFWNMFWNIWGWSCSFSLCTRISLTSSLTKDQTKISSINWYWCY